jgi:hypothetical protein
MSSHLSPLGDSVYVPTPARAHPAGAARAACAAAGAPGLVNTSTSHTLRIVPAEVRLRRMRRSVLTGSRLLLEGLQHGGNRFRAALLTLTYRPGVGWSPRHVSAILACIREYLRRRGLTFRYVWVMELTQAGIPHYHLLIFLPRGLTLPKPDKRGWWPHGLTRIEWARNAVGYLAKYASKGQEGAFPKGARLHSSGGLDKAQRVIRSWWMLPAWVRELWGSEHRPMRAKGGGFVSRLTGEHFPSPWRIVSRAKDWRWVELAQG